MVQIKQLILAPVLLSAVIAAPIQSSASSNTSLTSAKPTPAIGPGGGPVDGFYTRNPVSVPTKKPAQAPTQAPAGSPTRVPAKSPTKAPSRCHVQTHAKGPGKDSDRIPAKTGISARNALFGRDVSDEELATALDTALQSMASEDGKLVARDPFFGLLKQLFGLGRRDVSDTELDTALQGMASEDGKLMARDPFFGLLKKLFGLGRRDLSDAELAAELDAALQSITSEDGKLVARDPIIGLLKQLFGLGRRDNPADAELAAELDAKLDAALQSITSEDGKLVARDPIIGLLKQLFGLGRRDISEPELENAVEGMAGDLQELESALKAIAPAGQVQARDALLPFLFKAIPTVLGMFSNKKSGRDVAEVANVSEADLQALENALKAMVPAGQVQARDPLFPFLFKMLPTILGAGSDKKSSRDVADIANVSEADLKELENALKSMIPADKLQSRETR
ncbi:hypothetical protein AMS68_005034 [Peltaster fructicola]|uniref:EF-hand domain-containing protein n=1 Tax=Peltaster fructicola TaxID=286661 RepID=A0A6H0XXL8_9PEZI|nr:hypothetical protein AMS68_005034 [Peltaster fructicola]